MTLGEALADRYWMADPWNDKIARVCGPDNGASFIVEEVEDGGFDCWLRSGKNGEKLSDVKHVGDPSEVEGALEYLTRLREAAGDCPLCRLPMAVGARVATCACGYEMAVTVTVMVEVEAVCE